MANYYVIIASRAFSTRSAICAIRVFASVRHSFKNLWKILQKGCFLIKTVTKLIKKSKEETNLKKIWWTNKLHYLRARMRPPLARKKVLSLSQRSRAVWVNQPWIRKNKELLKSSQNLLFRPQWWRNLTKTSQSLQLKRKIQSLNRHPSSQMWQLVALKLKITQRLPQRSSQLLKRRF